MVMGHGKMRNGYFLSLVCTIKNKKNKCLSPLIEVIQGRRKGRMKKEE